MTLADSNVWLALALSDHVFHRAASDWLDEQPSSSVFFCRSTQQSFVRLITTRAVVAVFGVPPMSNKSAWSTYAAFRADSRVGWIEEPDGLEVQWKKWAVRATASPKLWMDAYLAAFAISSGSRFVTTDSGFKQFKGLDVVLLKANETHR